jgi:major membrane immunogen (membrane-anchored lipoprotein)
VPNATSPNARSGPCGDCENYSITVTITVSNGRITGASSSYSPSPSGTSGSDANKASTALASKIVTAQTWNMGKPVSGATYALNAWEQSARGAMQAAGLPV